MAEGFCQYRILVDTDCECDYVAYVMGTSLTGFFTNNHPIVFNIPNGTPVEGIAIKKVGLGLLFPDDLTLYPNDMYPLLPPGALIEEDSPEQCVYDSMAYRHNLQYGFDPASNTYQIKITCILE